MAALRLFFSYCQPAGEVRQDLPRALVVGEGGVPVMASMRRTRAAADWFHCDLENSNVASAGGRACLRKVPCCKSRAARRIGNRDDAHVLLRITVAEEGQAHQRRERRQSW